MFGGQDHNDDNTPPAQAGASDDDTAQPPADGALNGVDDLAATSPASTDEPGTDFMPSPSEPPQVDAADNDQSSSGHHFINDNDLLDLKQTALQQLTPLLDHLEQTPEERFRTTMMMIQASDNKDLLKHAYDAAQAIPDEKAKAQALLDVVNEINYFTQQKTLQN